MNGTGTCDILSQHDMGGLSGVDIHVEKANKLSGIIGEIRLVLDRQSYLPFKLVLVRFREI